MTKLAEIQTAIRALPPKQQDVLRVWLDEAPLDAEKNSPALEAALLKGMRSPHRELTRAELGSVVATRTSRTRQESAPPFWR